MKERRYQSAAAFKMGVEARLRTEETRTGTDLQRLRQLLVFDRFLARLFQGFKDAVMLKGGLVLEMRLSRARTTKDIDLRMIGAPDDVLPKLQAAGRMDLGDYLVFEVQPDPHHPELNADGMLYSGRRYRTEPRLAGKIYGRPFGVDVAFAEPLVGQPEHLRGSEFLSFAGIAAAEYRVCPLETHIAEKLHAYTLPRTTPNSRVKDLPDLALLASVRSIDSVLLSTAIRQTFDHRGTHPVPTAVPTAPAGWAPVYKRMAAIDNLRWENIDLLLAAVREFLDPILTEHEGNWDPTSWSWA